VGGWKSRVGDMEGAESRRVGEGLWYGETGTTRSMGAGACTGNYTAAGENIYKKQNTTGCFYGESARGTNGEIVRQ